MKHFSCDVCNAPIREATSWEDGPWMLSTLSVLRVARFESVGDNAAGQVHACSFECAVKVIEKWIEKERERMQRCRERNNEDLRVANSSTAPYADYPIPPSPPKRDIPGEPFRKI